MCGFLGEDKTEGKGIRKETEKEHYIETTDGTGKKEKEKSDSDGAAWSKELGKLGFDWFKDKGHRKHGWKNVYHKEEWGDSKKYHDIFHDRDWKKKWNKWDKEKEKKRKEKIEKKKANKEDEKKKAAKSVKKKQKKRGKHEMGSHLKSSERKSDGEKKKEEHGIGMKEKDDHHKHHDDGNDDYDHDSKASKRYVYRKRNRFDDKKEPDGESHKKQESGTTRDESNGSGDKDDDEVGIRSSQKHPENHHLSSSRNGHGMAKRRLIPENSKTSGSSSSRKNLKHQRPRHVYQQLLTHNQDETHQHGINESRDQDDGENWKKIRRGRRRQEAGDEVVSEEEGDGEKERRRRNRKHDELREGKRGEEEEGRHEISLADNSGGQEVKLQRNVKLRHEHHDDQEKENEEEDEDRSITSDSDVTSHDPGFRGKKQMMRQQQYGSSSSSFDPLYHHHDDHRHDDHRDTVSSFSSDLPASYRHQVPRSLLLPFGSHQDQHGYRPAVHPNDLYRPAGSHPSLFHPILPHFLF